MFFKKTKQILCEIVILDLKTDFTEGLDTVVYITSGEFFDPNTESRFIELGLYDGTIVHIRPETIQQISRQYIREDEFAELKDYAVNLKNRGSRIYGINLDKDK